MGELETIKKYISMYGLEHIINKAMVEESRLQCFKRGELICRLGDDAKTFYVMVEGRVKVYTASTDGKILSLRILEDISNFGDIEIMTETRYRCNVEALDNTICIAIPMEVTKKEGLSNNSFLRYLCKELCQKFDDITSVSSNNILYPLKNRLASYILSHRKDIEDIVNIPFSNKEIAELLGTTYRHLTRSYTELEDKGYIEVNNNFIKIINQKALEDLGSDIYPHKHLNK